MTSAQLWALGLILAGVVGIYARLFWHRGA
jgi:hypothetical protein